MDDFDFEYLAPVKTAKLPLGANVRVPPTNDKPVVLDLRFAGDGNAPYMNAQRTIPAPDDRLQRFERHAKIFGRHVVCGWENVLDKSGKPIEFSPAGAEKILLKLVAANRIDILSYLMAFAQEADNFHDPIVSGADLGKE